MKHLTHFMLFLCAILPLACDKDQTTLVVPGELTDIEQIRAYLQEALADNNLIVSIDSTSNSDIPYCALLMEDESVVYFKKKWLESSSPNPAQWQVGFTFTDGTQEEALYLGDTIYLDEDEIVVNPFGTAPLTALVPSAMPLKGRFGVRVMGKGPEGVPIHKKLSAFEQGQDIPVLGLYAAHTNEIEISFLNEGGDVRATRKIALTTSSVEGLLASLDIDQNLLPPEDDGIFFIADRKLGFDQRGEIRWLYTGDAKYLYRKLKNGNLVVATEFESINYHSRAFDEISILGETIQRYIVPNLMHHEIREMPNGNFLVASNSEQCTGSIWDGRREEDLIVEIDRTYGDVIKSWNLNGILDNQRPRADGVQNDDWLHLNAIYFDEEDNSIVLSSRHQSLVAKVDYETGDLKWILAHPAGWRSDLLPYILQPINADGSPVDLSSVDFLPYFLHAPTKLPNGDIVLYDNGNYRNFYENPDVPLVSYSRAVAYRINEAAGTVELVWQFDYGQQLFTLATGDIDYFEHNQHRLIGFLNGGDGTPKIVEIDADDQIVFEVNLNAGSYYRCEKIQLYDGL